MQGDPRSPRRRRDQLVESFITSSEFYLVTCLAAVSCLCGHARLSSRPATLPLPTGTVSCALNGSHSLLLSFLSHQTHQSISFLPAGPDSVGWIQKSSFLCSLPLLESGYRPTSGCAFVKSEGIKMALLSLTWISSHLVSLTYSTNIPGRSIRPLWEP